MKTIFLTTLVAAVCASSAALAQRFQQEALLIFEDEKFEKVWIADANKAKFLYYTTINGVDQSTMLVSKPRSIWLMEPAEYTEAMELYQARKYEEARSKFAAVRESYIKLRTLPDNHSALAAFYEMECLRKLGKLDELAKVQELFVPDDRNSLTRENQLAQLDLYTLWDAARTKDWARLELLCIEKLDTKMPGYQRAQVGYCLGLALEGQQKVIPAINAYNIAMTADTGTSEILTQKAAENALRLYGTDPAVQQAIRLYGTPDEEPNSLGSQRLGEAASLAALFEMTLGGGKPLSAEAKALLKYLPDAPAKPKAAPAEDAKKEDAKKPAPKKDGKKK
ncbi:hypothetical protein ACFQY0_18145 [Haloferula chungangensis]|uniref:Tetratricopeptide repeat protein n=1 Tax=Haloferula chungangensis TaxID=1048331 RepID=A0ABW2LDB4_9BACT